MMTTATAVTMNFITRAVLLSIGLAVVFPVSCGDGDKSTNGGEGGATSTSGGGETSPRKDFFVDEAKSRGLSFRHDSGGTGKRWTVEQIGAGGALFDIDGDGDLDCLLINGGPIPGSESKKENALFINDGTGRFRREPGARGLACADDYGIGCAVADVDQDGDLDCYLTHWNQDRLFLNDGAGNFRDATAASGIRATTWSASAVFGDVDGDSLPDLYVTHYVDWTFAGHAPCFQAKVPVFCGPNRYDGLRDQLFLNQGDGKFRDVSGRLPAAVSEGKSLAVAMADPDDDGDLDIYVANDQTPNFLLENDGKGRFKDIGLLSAVALSQDAEAEAGMGVAFTDYDNDGHEDIAVTNFEDQTNAVYHNTGDGFFEECSFEVGTGYDSRPLLAWGIGVFDFDHDGWKDMFVGNGHVYDNTNLLKEGTTWAQSNLLNLGDGRGKFRPAKDVSIPALDDPTPTRGVLFGDVDNDGDIDVVTCNMDGDAQLLINHGARGHWIVVDAINAKSGSPAIGARVDITTKAGRQCARVQGGSSYAAANDLRVHFGLGEENVVGEVVVKWLDGTRHRFENVATGRLLRVRSDGTAESVELATGKVVEKVSAK